MANKERVHGYVVDGLLMCAIAGVYYAAARVGLLLELVREQVTPLWPPTGVALISLLWWGLRVWPGITVGAFLANAAIGPSVPVVVAIAAGNTLAPICSYLLLRLAAFRTELARLRDALALVFLGALTGTLVSSTVGSGSLILGGPLSAINFWPTWSVWWTGDAMGVLVVAPVLLILPTVRWPGGTSPHRWAEAVLLLAGAAAVTLAVTRGTTLNLMFLVFPFLIWAAVRFQLAGAAPCTLVVSVLTITAAADGIGPFEGHDLFAQMFTLQAFNGSISMTALMLSALITQRNVTMQQIAHVVGLLGDAVTRLVPGERPEEWPPPPQQGRRKDSG